MPLAVMLCFYCLGSDGVSNEVHRFYRRVARVRQARGVCWTCAPKRCTSAFRSSSAAQRRSSTWRASSDVGGRFRVLSRTLRHKHETEGEETRKIRPGGLLITLWCPLSQTCGFCCYPTEINLDQGAQFCSDCADINYCCLFT